ncbi:hypothetical protein GF420_13160 [candidate division GN15 bacterium]|nr:hypothetical protein [candidate division GN15 bacterium]
MTDDADARLYMYKDGETTHNFTTGSVEKNFTNTLSAGTESYPVIGIDLEKATDTAFVYSETQYAVTVRYPYSTDATLASLESSPGFLEPSFAADTTTYDLNVALSSDSGVNSVDLTPTTIDDRATVAINGTSATSGSTISGSTATFRRVKALAINRDNADISYCDTVAGVEQWSLELEVFSGSQSMPMAPIEFAPAGTVYIQAKNNSEGVLICTR